MILIPAAGKGQRFKEAGYKGPKHLIPLAGVPLIGWVSRNLHELSPDDEIKVITTSNVGDTRGITETISLTPVNPNEQLVIGNCDQLLKFPDHDDWRKGDGVVFTFPSSNPAHSYVSTPETTNRITEIVEKEVVSRRAVSGVYWFKKAGPIMEACERITAITEGEMYLSYALALMIDRGYKLYAYDAPTAILGTPEDFQRFEVAMELCS